MSETAAEWDITGEQVAFVFRQIAENIREGGTFRKLIYDRLGFAENSYQMLYKAGGMYITNLVEPKEINVDEFLLDILKLVQKLDKSTGLDTVIIVSELKRKIESLVD